MRKILVIVSSLIILATVLTSLVLPNYVSYTIYNYLKNDMHARNIQGEVQTHPPFMIADGKIDRVYYKADAALIGQTEVHDLLLTGDKLYIDMPDLLQQRFTVDKAEDIALSCTIDEKSLERLLLQKITRLHSATVLITPQLVTVTANIPILDNNIAANMTGSIYTADGNIYFKIAEFNVENTLLGKISLNTQDAIMLLDKNKLPFGARIDSVTQENNQISIKASAHKE
ncbi:DUF2993 domain-containing protein [Pectinatus cerevisiiphilus]|uniref:LmeA family phospholipid-binding protein n=1 Tax=Pectinatus cerevisiiphilus TaxID=86956 RepID=UPI001048D187|nr:DUF2993 domain-containing protein [Pectinatus cerevisiiphilus]